MGLTTLRRKNSLMEKFYSNTMLEWGRKNSLKEESVQDKMKETEKWESPKQ